MTKSPRQFFLLVVIGTVLLIGVFLSVLLQEDTTLRNSLIDLGILPPVRRDAVLVAHGTILRGEITQATLRASEGPYILDGIVRVPEGHTLSIEAGTSLAANEGAQLRVAGTLRGTSVVLFANHLHPRRRLWHGIVVEQNGQVLFEDTRISDASAALTCGADGTLSFRRGVLTLNAAGVVALPKSRRCVVEGTRITDGRVGLQLTGGTPEATRISFDRVFDAVRVFHNARPTLSELTVRRPLRSAIVYAATPDLIIRTLTLAGGLDPAALILDGTDTPAHPWEGQEYSTGRVLLH